LRIKKKQTRNPECQQDLFVHGSPPLVQVENTTSSSASGGVHNCIIPVPDSIRADPVRYFLQSASPAFQEQNWFAFRPIQA
jgi:hypothetical protein